MSGTAGAKARGNGRDPSPSATRDSFTGRSAWARNLAAPVRDFLGTETGGALVLLCAALAALAWANSPWSDSYESLWTTKLSIRLGSEGISLDLRHWVNQGLMTFFFLVVGLEAKRELDTGRAARAAAHRDPGGRRARRHGACRSRSTWPSTRAAPGAHGWGAAMSTDTAFALGVLALVAPGGTRLRVRLLTLAVVDDLVALVVIAVVYTEHVSLVPLARRGRPVRRPARRCATRPPAWRAPDRGGRRRRRVGGAVRVGDRSGHRRARGRPRHERLPAGARRPRAGDRADALVPRAADARARALGAARRGVGDLAERAPPVPPAPVDELRDRARCSRSRTPASTWTAQLLGDAVTSPITLGIVVRLRGRQAARHRRRVAGSRSRPRLAGLRRSLSWPVIVGGGAVAGIGFTVSLLIASLAFDGPAARGGEARRAGRRGRGVAPGAGRVPGDRAAARPRARAPDRRHGRGARSTSPRTSTPSATTSAAPRTRR